MNEKELISLIKKSLKTKQKIDIKASSRNVEEWDYKNTEWFKKIQEENKFKEYKMEEIKKKYDKYRSQK